MYYFTLTIHCKILMVVARSEPGSDGKSADIAPFCSIEIVLVSAKTVEPEIDPGKIDVRFLCE